MVLFRASALIFIVFIYKVGAIPSNPESSPVEKRLDKEVYDLLHHRLNYKTIHASYKDYNKYISSAKHFVLSAENSLKKLQTCKPDSKLELCNRAVLRWADFQNCINATRDIAGFEQFLFDFYNYGVNITIDSVYLVGNIFECHKQPDIFDSLKCIVSTIQEAGPEVNCLMEKAIILITQLQIDTNSFISDVKKCFGLSVSQFALEAFHLINEEC